MNIEKLADAAWIRSTLEDLSPEFVYKRGYCDAMRSAAVRAEEPKEAVAFEWRKDWPKGGFTRHLCTDLIEAEEYNDSYKEEGVISPLFLHPQPAVPEGYKLLKNSTFNDRSWIGDRGHENGCYINECADCGRTFLGHKRRVVCKVCSTSAAEVTK